MKITMKTTMKTAQNVGVTILAVCFLEFLLFCGNQEPNHVVAQNQEKTQPQPLTQEQLEAIAIQPATMNKETGSRVVPAMLPLFKEESITYTGKKKYNNTVLKYRLHVPENMEPDKKYPLILWLHGAGEVGDDNKLQLVHLHHIITYLTGEKKRDFFLLVPQAPQNHGTWEAHSYTQTLPETLKSLLNNPQTREKILKQYESAFGSETKATVAVTEIDGESVLTTSEPLEDSPLGFSFAMLDQVLQNYPVDTNRITVSGLSSGGDGTWRALEYRPELFAAAVPLVSWRALTDVALQKSPVLKKIPIWAIYSSDDNSIDYARSSFERVEKAGCNVKKSEFGICGHNAWTPAMLQADIFSWLLSRAKKDGEYIAVVDANVNPDDLKGIVDVATRDPGKPKLAPAPPQTVSQTATETAKTELKPAASFSVPQPQPNVVTRKDSSDNIVTETIAGKSAVPNNNAKDELYAKLATYYFNLDCLEEFSRNFVKLSPVAQKVLAGRLLMQQELVPKKLQILEKMIDQMPLTPIGTIQVAPIRVTTSAAATKEVTKTETRAAETPQIVTQTQTRVQTPTATQNTPQFTAQHGSDEEVTVTGKMIEDCDRPWAMTSDSLYGMFPADWNKEAQKIPEFIVELDSDKLAKKLAASVSGDGKDFVTACQSILVLENKPMSSPWFETGGGRLRSDIRYTLSAKGQMFVRLLKTVKDSTGNAEKLNRAKLAQKTLEKFELILE